MIDVGDRIGRRQEPGSDHQPHAEPERDPRHDREARDLARGETRWRIDPIADRGPRHQRKPERERKGVAGEGRQRRQPVGNLDAQMAKRQSVIAGQREIAQRGEGEGEHELIAARRGDRRLDLVRIDADKHAQKDGERAGNDDDAGRDAQPPKRGTVTRNGVDQAIDECRRLRRRRFDRRPVQSRASFLGLRHATFLLEPPPIGPCRLRRKQSGSQAIKGARPRLAFSRPLGDVMTKRKPDQPSTLFWRSAWPPRPLRARSPRPRG